MSRSPDTPATVSEWRIEAINDAGEIRALIYDGWEQDEANRHTLERLRVETGDPSWTTILVRDDSIGIQG